MFDLYLLTLTKYELLIFILYCGISFAAGYHATTVFNSDNKGNKGKQ